MQARFQQTPRPAAIQRSIPAKQRDFGKKSLCTICRLFFLYFDAMLQALKRYRQSRELSPLPAPSDMTPLIPKIRGKDPVTSTRHLQLLAQDCFDRTYERMCQDGLRNDATDQKESTVHWLHHTGISEDVRTRPREHVRDDAGQATMATTDRYIESDQRERQKNG
jgi:hypothetical protein